MIPNTSAEVFLSLKHNMGIWDPNNYDSPLVQSSKFVFKYWYIQYQYSEKFLEIWNYIQDSQVIMTHKILELLNLFGVKDNLNTILSGHDIENLKYISEENVSFNDLDCITWSYVNYKIVYKEIERFLNFNYKNLSDQKDFKNYDRAFRNSNLPDLAREFDRYQHQLLTMFSNFSKKKANLKKSLESFTRYKSIYQEIAVRSVKNFISKAKGMDVSGKSRETIYKFQVDSDTYECAIQLFKESKKMSIHFGFGTLEEIPLTNKNVQYKVLANVAGCVEDFIETYTGNRDYGWSNKFEIEQIYISSKSEYKEDTRRLDLYNQYFNHLVSKYGVTVLNSTIVNYEDEPTIIFKIEPFTIPVRRHI